ncbi:MAG: threonine synthase [Flexilinea sp.]
MPYPLNCTICKKPYAGLTDQYVCPYCGGSIESTVDLSADHEVLKEILRNGSDNGIWGFRRFLPIDEQVTPISLGEGNTPFIKADRLGKEFGLNTLYIKNETLNPSGSYKDRFATVAISLEKAAATRTVALGSAGNAAAAVSAYSAMAGITCFILLPPGAVQERAWQNMSYGAHFIQANGNIKDCIDMVVAGEKVFGWKNLATTMLHNPYGAEGYKTISYEIARSMKFEVPDYILCPVGGGILMSKVYRGYTEMYELGLTDKIPRMIGVQAEGCAPLVKAFRANKRKTDFWENPNTIAFAINDPCTFEGVTALDVLYKSNGFAEAVSDEEIIYAMRLSASREAVLAEPASASVLAAVKKLATNGTLKKDDSIVCVVTGSALRDLNLLAGDKLQGPQVRLNNMDDLIQAVEFYGGITK